MCKERIIPKKNFLETYKVAAEKAYRLEKLGKMTTSEDEGDGRKKRRRATRKLSSSSSSDGDFASKRNTGQSKKKKRQRSESPVDSTGTLYILTVVNI